MKHYVPIFHPIRLFVLLTAIVSGLLFFGCDADPPIQIGFIGSLTGRMADMGISARNAVQLAVEQCNEQGGIHGRRVNLIIKDDRQDADTAVRSVRELIAADVAAIIGPTGSNVAMAIVPYVNDARVVDVGPSITTPDLSGRDDYFFRVCTTARELGHHSADYQIRSGDMRRIAVAHEVSNRSFSESWLGSFQNTFVAGGGKILTTIEFTTDDGCAFSTIAHKLLASDPDGILIIAPAMNSALLCQHIRNADPSINITLSSWSANQRFIELGGKAAEGVTVPSVFDWDSPSPPYQTFRRISIEHYQRDPGTFGFYAYNAAQVVLTALTAKKRDQHLKDTLLSIGEFDGLQGKIRFDAYGDVAPSSVTMRIVRNRQFVVVE